jgi:serine/threonine-protein kinase
MQTPVHPQRGFIADPAEPSDRAADREATRVRVATPGRQGLSTPASASLPSTGTLPGHGTLPGTPVKRVGRYLIRGHLGRGGMASVYRAHDPRIGRDVAIKFLHGALSADPECRARFLREARAAGALSHRNIVTVHDVGEIEGRPCMAMELLEGETLGELLARKGPLPLREVLMIGVQLARALDYAHARGIVHRDIKPGNVMRLPDGTIKVTDFGIAHMDDGLPGHTQVGAVLGTPQYMSPEQARGERLDGRSDLFAAGIVLYQLLTGQRPFEADTAFAVVEQLMHKEPVPLATSRPDTPPALRRAVERCLAKRAADRPANGRELALALLDVLEALDENAAAGEHPRFVPLHVRWALALATIVALVMGFTASLVTQRLASVLQQQASDYGAAMARFIALQQAGSVLGEEWALVAVAVQEMARTRQFERLAVLDAAGVVRAGTVVGEVGQAAPVRPASLLGLTEGGVRVLRLPQGDGASAALLRFEAPVQYRDRHVGTVVLDVSEAPLAQTTRLAVMLLGLLLLVTVLAAAAAAALAAWRFTQGLRVLAKGLHELAQARFAYRIGQERRDELGEIYRAFDGTAAALQRRQAPELARTPPPRGA